MCQITRGALMSKRIELLILLFISVSIFVVIFPLINDKNAETVNAISTAIMAVFALCSIYISLLFNDMNKRQAALQMNQAFNQINQLILSDKTVRKIAHKYYFPQQSANSSETISNIYYDGIKKNLGNCYEKLFEDKLAKESFIFSILNIYEAYYINNGNSFPNNRFPQILRNMLQDEDVKRIICSNEYDIGFKIICGCSPTTTS